MVKYKPADSQESPRFSGIKTFMRMEYKKTTEDIDFAVVGIPAHERVIPPYKGMIGEQACYCGGDHHTS